MFFLTSQNEIYITTDDSSRIRCVKKNHHKIIQCLVTCVEKTRIEVMKQKKHQS